MSILDRLCRMKDSKEVEINPMPFLPLPNGNKRVTEVKLAGRGTN